MCVRFFYVSVLVVHCHYSSGERVVVSSLFFIHHISDKKVSYLLYIATCASMLYGKF